MDRILLEFVWNDAQLTAMLILISIYVWLNAMLVILSMRMIRLKVAYLFVLQSPVFMGRIWQLGLNACLFARLQDISPWTQPVYVLQIAPTPTSQIQLQQIVPNTAKSTTTTMLIMSQELA